MCLFLFKCPLLSYYEADNNVPTSLLVVVPMAIYIFYVQVGLILRTIPDNTLVLLYVIP